MNIDLELILTIGVLLTGGIWLWDSFFLAAYRKKRKRYNTRGSSDAKDGQPPVHHEPWYIEYSKSFFPVLLIVLILRSFVAEPFRIPSGSMMPTLLVGDFILVSKYAYGIRLPVLKTKILEIGEPKRGDVAVFRFPRNPSDDYIKRIIGLPGDRVAYYNKSVYINGKEIEQIYVGAYNGFGSGSVMNNALMKRETLENVEHDILITEDRMNVNGEYIVPSDHYFVLGDNRDNSNDSRFWGFVPEENLVGKAFIIWLNWDFQGGSFDASRIGERII